MSFRRGLVALFLALAIGSSSGCGLIVRAAKGELVPLGVDQLAADGLGQRARTLAETDDAGEFRTAFVDLTSVYLYKCLEHPTKVPERGDDRRQLPR